jgi:hypothetical protein
MTIDTKQFPPLDPDSFAPVAFNFGGYLGAETVASVDWVQISVYRGTDSDPAARLYGAPASDGTKAVQWLQNLVDGVTYKLRARITDTAGRKFVLTGLLRAAQ